MLATSSLPVSTSNFQSLTIEPSHSNALPDINIPIFLGLYLFWKWWQRTRIWEPHMIDFVTGVPPLDETETPEKPLNGLLEKIAELVF
jgi:hypothetical protein